MAQKKTVAPAKKTAKKSSPAADKGAPPAQAAKAKGTKKGGGELPEIVAIPFQLRILDGIAESPFSGTIKPPTYYAVEIREALSKRFAHLILKEGASRFVMTLLADRDALGKNRRLPAAGAWLRAIVEGEAFLLGADVPLLREEIAKYLGGHEPPPTATKPPYV